MMMMFIGTETLVTQERWAIRDLRGKGGKGLLWGVGTWCRRL